MSKDYKLRFCHVDQERVAAVLSISGEDDTFTVTNVPESVQEMLSTLIEEVFCIELISNTDDNLTFSCSGEDLHNMREDVEVAVGLLVDALEEEEDLALLGVRQSPDDKDVFILDGLGIAVRL